MITWTKEQQAEHRKLWVEALRSGKYKQTRKRLRDETGFCCLGVACEVSGLGRWVEGRFVLNGDEVTSASIMLPQAVREFYGIAHGEGGFGKSGLTHENDSVRATFEQIADIIESEPPGLLIQAAS